MIAPLPAPGSSPAYGRADFPGGPGARKAHVLRTVTTAARSGGLAVVAVVTALYPAGTVLLARSVLTERVHCGQLAGLGTAAVSLLALT